MPQFCIDWPAGMSALVHLKCRRIALKIRKARLVDMMHLKGILKGIFDLFRRQGNVFEN